MMAFAALIKSLKKKGYITLTKGQSNHTLVVSEYNARKMAREIREKHGYNARAIKTSQVSKIGDTPLWMVMYKIKRRKS